MRIKSWLGIGFAFGLLGCSGGEDALELEPGQEQELDVGETQQQAIGAAVTVSFQDGVAPTAAYKGTADTMLAQSAPSRSFGQATLIRVDGDDPYPSLLHKHALLKWDVSAIPAGSTIQSASITLNVTDPTNQTYTFYRVFGPWPEATTTWNSFAKIKRGTIDRGSASPRAMGLQTFRLNAQGVAAVSEWVKNPSGNGGLALLNDRNWDGINFNSREVPTATLRPKLTVTYIPPATGGTGGTDTGGTGTGGTGTGGTGTGGTGTGGTGTGGTGTGGTGTGGTGTGGTGTGGTGTGGTGTGGTGTGGTSGSAFLYDDFNGPLFSMTSTGLMPNGLWRVDFLSGGFARTVQDPTNPANQYLVMAPRLDVLRSAQLNTTKTWKGIHGKMRARLDQQLPPGTGWYTFWPFLAYVDVTTHYYFNLKTDGWELGKKDNDHPPAEEIQLFLRTGSSPRAVVGQWNALEWWVVKDTASNNLRIRVNVNGVTVVDMVDNQPWHRNGTTGGGTSAYFLNADKRVTLYSEASQVSWDDVYIEEATSIP